MSGPRWDTSRTCRRTRGDRSGKGVRPTYLVMESKKKVLAELKKAATKADQIFLAP
jgi:hypothetical protein